MTLFPRRLSELPIAPGQCLVCHKDLPPGKVWNRIHGAQGEQIDLCQPCSERGYTFWNGVVCANPQTEAATERRFPIKVDRTFTGEREFVLHTTWETYARHIERKNLREQGRSLTASGIERRANGFIIEIQDDRQGMMVYQGWRAAMRLDTPEKEIAISPKE